MNKKEIEKELKKLGVEIPEGATAKELKALLTENEAAKEDVEEEAERAEEVKEKVDEAESEEKEELPKEETPEIVTLYDVNEKAIKVSPETAEDLLKLNKGYRKELPKK